MAQFGNFVSSTPVGPGLYQFGLKDGKSVTLAGPTAEDLNKRLTAGIQPPILATGPGALAAGPAPTDPNVASDAPTVQQNAVAQAGQAVENRDGKKVASMPLGRAKDLLSSQAPALDQPPPTGVPAAPRGRGPEPQQQAPQPQGDTPLGYTMEAIGPGGQKVVGPAVKRPDGSIGVFVPPSAGSPGGFTALGKETVARHAATEAGVQDAEQRAAAAKAMGAQAEIENMAAQEGAAEEAKWQAGLAAQEQQDEVQAKQARLDDLNRRYEQVAEDARNSKVDEGQYMRGARGVLSTIGMAMGAFGAVLGRSPNFAQQFVENQIERNIRQQELDLRNKRDSANALGNLRDKFDGDLNLAKGVLRQLTTEKVAAQNRSASLTAKSDQMRNYYAEAAALGEAAALRQREALGMAFNEKVLKDPLYYRQGRAGSSGGYLQPTLAGVQNVKDLQKTDAASGGTQHATPSAAVESLAGMGQAIVAANKIRRALGTETSERDDPLAGPIDRAVRLVSGDAEREASELEQATVALAKGVQTAFGKSDRDAEDALQMASGGGTSAARLRAADSLQTRAVEQARQTLAGLPPDQQKAMISAMPPEARKAILGEQ